MISPSDQLHTLTSNTNDHLDRILFLAIQFLSQTHHTCVTINTEHWSRDAVPYGATIWIDACEKIELNGILQFCVDFLSFTCGTNKNPLYAIRQMLTGCGFQTTEFQKRIIRFIILYGHVNTMHDKNETKQEEKKNTAASIS